MERRASTRQQTTVPVTNWSRIRGLRWCSTCRELASRDRNARKNIYYAYEAESQGLERPSYLLETDKRGTLETKRLYGKKKARTKGFGSKMKNPCTSIG